MDTQDENLHADLIQEIDDFLAKTGMGVSYFGKKAVGNSEVVARLKRGKDITFKTANSLRAYMAENAPSEDGDAA